MRLVISTARSFSLLASLAFVAPIAEAQSTPAFPTNAPQPNGGTPAAAALRKAYDDLVRYIVRKPTLTADDRRAIAQVLEQVRAYPRNSDTTPYAMEVQLAAWLEEWDAVDAAYAKIIEIQPRNETALTQWVTSLTKRGRYGDAIEAATSRVPNLGTMPRAAVAVAEALIASNRFDDALALLEPLAEVAAGRPDLAAIYKTSRDRAAMLAPRWTQESALRTADAARDDLPRVEIVTAKGVLSLELFEDQAPAATAAILSLVESGAYNGTRFHQRIPGLAVLGGDPNTKVGATGRPGFGSPGWRVPDESHRPDRRGAFSGTFGLAKPNDPKKPGAPLPNSAGQTLFFLLTPAEHIQDGFTIAGRVVDGFDVLTQLESTDEIAAARVVRKREHAYEWPKLPDLETPAEATVPTPMRGPPKPVDVSRSGAVQTPRPAVPVPPR